MGRNVGLQILRGIKVNIPTLLVGELYFCTDTHDQFIGTTSGNLRLTIPTYDATGTLLGNTHIVMGTVTLSGGGTATVTLAGAAAFTSATSYRCIVADRSAKRVPQVTQISGSSFSLSGSGGDVINYICIGN